MKKKVWATPNRMLIETGHATFDRQTNVIGTGNIIANTQSAFFVRGELCVKCWGPKVYQPGELRDYDLGNWPKMPSSVRIAIVRMTRGQQDSIWVSEFFHYNGRRRITHGYIITDRVNGLLYLACRGPTYKSIRVLRGVLPYVVKEGWESSNCGRQLLEAWQQTWRIE